MALLDFLFPARRPATPNRGVSKVSRGGQNFAIVHGTSKAGQRPATVQDTLGIARRLGGRGGNASGLSGGGHGGGRSGGK